MASDELRSAYLTIAEHYAWTYDNLGRLSSDGRNGAEPIRTAYSYNIRSWQTGVSSGVFSEELHYTDPSACGASSAPQFNGSISSSVWSLSGGLRKGYGYSYDGLGRVTGAEWLLGGRPASGYGTSYSYDSHGNIMSLSRERGSVPDEGDDLMMAYSGNRLHAMSDHGGSMIPDHLAGSIPSGMTQYAYDANGNMTRDLNSGLTVMSYNRLNLPDELTCVGSEGVHSIRYLYASDGRKLRVSTSGPGGSSSVTDYASNVVYRDGSLDRILIPGGYMTDGNYRFFMTDHLGSIRAVTDASGNVLHTYDYYPYGVEFPDGAASGSGVAVGGDADAAASDVVAVQSGVSDGATGSGAVPDGLGVTIQPYRFNGKESQKFARLPYLDYGARFYHQLSSRWTTMDPMAEKYYSVSPYAFCSGNPVNFVDWDGEDFTRKIRRNTIYISAVYYTDEKSMTSAKQAVSFWNSRTGDTYTDESGKVYNIKYELSLLELGTTRLKEKSENKTSNTYIVNDEGLISENTAGQTDEKFNITIRKSYSITKPGTKERSTTGAHEIGHSLGMDHKETGIMTKAQDENRTSDVPQENINEMVQSNRGTDDWLSKLSLLLNNLF